MQNEKYKQAVKEKVVKAKQSTWELMLHTGIDLIFHAPFANLDSIAPHLRKLSDFKIWLCPKGYTNKKFSLKHLNLELLQKQENTNTQKKLILQCHGGGYLIKLINLYRNNAIKLAEISNADVLTFDYRVAPEHCYPAALEDALLAWNYAIEKGYTPDNVIIVGDSAGGNLALALTLYLRDNNLAMPKALVLMSPWTDMSFSQEAFVRNNEDDPFFGRHSEAINPNSIPKPLTFAYAGNLDLQDEKVSPAFAQYHNFPPTLIQVGTCEILEDDSKIIYDKITQAKGVAYLTKYEKMFHVFQIAMPTLEKSKQAWQEVQDFLEKYF